MTEKVARADIVGSLLRPPYLLEAKDRMRAGTMSPDELREIEDRAVLEAIALQEAAGIQAISDGEYRRNAWVAIIPVRDDPLYQPPVSGFEFMNVDAAWWSLWKDEAGNPIDGATAKQQFNFSSQPIIREKLKLNRNIVNDEYPFLKQHSHVRTKYNFPSPSWHRIYWHPDYSSRTYPTSDDFIRAVAEFQREHIIEPLLSMGCDYIQLDAPNYAQWHIDPYNRRVFEENGHDMAHELVADAEFDNLVFAGVKNITTGIHLCRGNGRHGMYFASGGYESISKEVFPRLTNINTLLLEYDTDRAGGFEPLADTLAHQVVVLGLVSTKEAKLEDQAGLIARIHEAARIVPLQRLAISPQCGFASGEVATNIPPAAQRAKLELLGAVAREVWGS